MKAFIFVLWFLIVACLIKNIQQDTRIEEVRQQCVMKEQP